MTHAESDISSFGALLHTFRKRQRLPQHRLAQALGVHRSTLIRWEQGDYLPESKALVLELARHLKLDNQEARQLLEASLTALAPYWHVPLPRNPFFTGREEVLEALHAQLGFDQAVALTQSAALQGLGGVGKTQIALEYAYRHALQYSAVFWIGAETSEQILASFLRVAEMLQLPGRDDKDQQRVIAAVQHWLSSHRQWLLIWDNVEDLALLDRFLPSTRSGAILLTTRCQILGTFARGLDLSPMEHEEGVLFLLRRAKVFKPEATSEQMRQLAERMPAHSTAAADLVTVMGGLPLALDQAGAYLEATQCGLPAYLELFCTRRAALLKLRGQGSRDHPASVSTTFTLAITTITQHHSAVRDLLQVCALLQPDAIPEELFRQGSQHLGPALEAMCCDPLEWDRAVGLVCAYSLLARQPGEHTLSMHRLMQAVLLDEMMETDQEQWNRRVIEALNAVFPEVGRATTSAVWKPCERLLPHVLLSLHRVGGTSQSLAYASLGYKTAFYLFQRGQYMEAEPLFERALQLREHVLGSEHPEVAASLNRLAYLFLKQGRYAEAEPLFKRALRIWEQVLGPEHAETVAAHHNLGLLFLSQGRYAEAEPLFERALRIWEQVLGPDHPKVAAALHNLADLYLEQGKYEAAEPLFLHALRIWEQVWGPEDTDVAYALRGLAELSREVGNYEAAESFFRRSLRIREHWFGSEHPLVAEVLHGQAALSLKQERVEQAERFYQQALALRERCLGLAHPDTAETLHDLALLRKTQGRLDEACSLAERAFNIGLQALGETHPKTLATQALYDQLLQEQAGIQKTTRSEHNAVAASPPRAVGRAAENASSAPPGPGDPVSSELDPLQAFLDACCKRHPQARCRSSDLWQAYERWVEKRQDPYPLSRMAFTQQLKEAGCRADRTNRARIWRGITLVDREIVTGSDGE